MRRMRQVRQRLNFSGGDEDSSCRGISEELKFLPLLTCEDLLRNSPECEKRPNEDFRSPEQSPADLRDAETPRSSSETAPSSQPPTSIRRWRKSYHPINNKQSLYSPVTPKSEIKRRGININPFTPDSLLLQAVGAKRHRREQTDSCEDFCEEKEFNPPSKKQSFGFSPKSRYTSEFYELEKIGTGKFGSVFKCVKRLDGCVYAVKRFNTPGATSADEQKALREVYAHAVLGQHPHVVRYYSAWSEDEHMLIQNEYCAGGTLEHLITENRRTLKFLSEAQLKDLLLQVSRGLKYIHSASLVHMDIKPSIIYLSRRAAGHNADVHESDEDVDYRNLPKADIFALSLTVLSALGAKELPRNGEQWHNIRKGKLPIEARVLSEEFQQLLKLMIHPDPVHRPSSSAVSKYATLQPSFRRSADTLRQQLYAQKFRNELLLKELKEIQSSKAPEISISYRTMNCCKRNKYNRLSGSVEKKINRSLSLPMF
ncbi:Wee1-like protein kinase [Bagarius yarrelli]|uniref:non-specific protein-tyrosine kinase n=1 Tax=Bagarius yarrelli TaxID=175774 RepID=A0A556VCD3_BAGYA|nr:Wee1-like protein kinase [Bagarius yarrelli]